MSKNIHHNKNQSNEERNSAIYSAHEAEYKDIKKDLARVILLNSIIFLVILTVYYTDKSSGYLQKVFEKLF